MRLPLLHVLLHWLPMAVLTTTILWCAARLWGRTSPRCFQLPIHRNPVAIGVLVATGILWGVWTNRLTADIFAIALILAILNLSIQISGSFWAWSCFGMVNVGYDIFTNYIVDTQTAASRDAVAHASPTVLVVGSTFGLLDVAIPGAIIMVAATVAYRHRRMAVLYGGLAGYLAGLAACEVVILLSGRGVAAMMALVPATMAGILLPAWRTGLLPQLSPRASRAASAATSPAPADTQAVPSPTEPS